MIPRNELDVDVLVVGAGPSGSTLATLVALAGHRVLILDQALPRHAGMLELLPPATVHGVFRLTGAEALLRCQEHTESHGATLWGCAWGDPWSVPFAAAPHRSSDATTAHHVERAQLKKILTDAARRQGAEFRDQCTVVDLFEQDGRVAGAYWVASDGVRRRTTSRYVVDATGFGGNLDGDEPTGNDAFTTFFSYFTGARRTSASCPDDSFVAAFDGGEFWCVPFGPDLTGVRVVVRDIPNISRMSDVTADADGIRRTVQDLLDRCPAAAQYLSGGRPVTEGRYGEAIRRTARTHARPTFWRPGLVRIGEAACVVEPSLGRSTHLATFGALQAARSINTAMLGGVDEPLLFEEFEARYRAEYRRLAVSLDALAKPRQDDNALDVTGAVAGRPASNLERFAEVLGGFSSHDPVLCDATCFRDRRAAPAWFADLDAMRPTTAASAPDPSRDRRLLALSVDGIRWDSGS
ncbi:tryptophan 7-halogenase [Dactylosporangium sp. NPDC049525]|uniref:NAD(P)/FAD-dependent oxidoreductase n=1 Tax=Dactylosporangium sp. NPDC049525 TaxID=3154730 RepID=UPI0034386858